MRKPGKRLFRFWRKIGGGRHRIAGILAICFSIGILLGIFSVHMGIDIKDNEIGAQLENFFYNFNPSDYQKASIILEGMFKYGLFLVLIWFLGFFPAGALGALAILLVKGLSLGFAAAFFVKIYGVEGLFYMAALTLPQNLLIIPAYFFVCRNCLRFILEQGGLAENKQIPPLSFLEYCIVLMICLGAAAAASFYEAFAMPWVFENLLI